MSRTPLALEYSRPLKLPYGSMENSLTPAPDLAVRRAPYSLHAPIIAHAHPPGMHPFTMRIKLGCCSYERSQNLVGLFEVVCRQSRGIPGISRPSQTSSQAPFEIPLDRLLSLAL